LSIPPNPLTGNEVFIAVKNGLESLEIIPEVYNNVGQRLPLKYSLEGATIRINLPEVSSGIYMMKLKDRGGNTIHTDLLLKF
jgi:hypothetical protein